MDEDGDKIPSELFSCFSQTGAAIVDQKYREALSILEQGLNQSYDSVEMDGLYLLENFRALVGLLGYSLRKAYGENWKESVEIPEIPKAEARCSFCGKTPEEVMKIIAGPGVFICNECIYVCNESLATESGSG